jgi:lipid-binding SYLF domain-containing protein
MIHMFRNAGESRAQSRKFAVAMVLAAALSLFTLVQVAVAKDLSDREDLARKSAEVMADVMKAPDKGIPHELLHRSHAIAIIPNVVKGALGIGGRFGKGLMSKRNADGTWGTPTFIEIGGASVGFQIGVSSTDLVLVFTDETSLKAMNGDRLKLGADASVVAGPVGRTAEAGVSGSLKSGIFAYSRSKGLFAGVALDGAVLTINDSANHEVYGEKVTGRTILDSKVKPSPVVMPFLDALNKYAPHQDK